jgi:hypothetical protein
MKSFFFFERERIKRTLDFICYSERNSRSDVSFLHLSILLQRCWLSLLKGYDVDFLVGYHDKLYQMFSGNLLRSFDQGVLPVALDPHWNFLSTVIQRRRRIDVGHIILLHITRLDLFGFFLFFYDSWKWKKKKMKDQNKKKRKYSLICG